MHYTFDILKILHSNINQPIGCTDAGVVCPSTAHAMEQTKTKGHTSYGWNSDGSMSRNVHTGFVIVSTPVQWFDNFSPAYRSAKQTQVLWTLNGEVMNAVYSGHLNRNEVQKAIMKHIGYLLANPDGAD